ncbi:MAG: hypothetical protein PH343_07980, partial [Nitrospira sp.]|nr:hypothetical protein [Nitrospira sp.]
RHEFQPRIELSLDAKDTTPFYQDGEKGEEYFLAIREGKMVILWMGEYDSFGYQSDDDLSNEIKGRDVTTPSRQVLKELVLSGRLPRFFQVVLTHIEKTSEEYQEVSEIAERMAQAISS